MRVVILTKTEYREFIVRIISPYAVQDDRNVWNITIVDDTGSFIPLDYDIGISFMWTKKVPAHHVNTHTWINFHPAPLPEYKGRNLCYHAIMNGETKFGATIHYMDENFDTGDIIDVFRFYITPEDTAETLSKFTIEVCQSMFRSYFPEIISGKQFERIPNLGGTYYEKEPIHPYVIVDELTEKQIRAIYYPPHFPKVRIGNTDYRIVEEE